MEKRKFILTKKKIEKNIILLIFVFISLNGFSQSVSINTTGNQPNSSAGVDVDFNTKGLLIPRVALISTTNFAPLSAHVAGMVVYNTNTAADVKPGFYYNSGTEWITTNVSGNSAGEMQYWNGTHWVIIPAGQPGQLLQINGTGIPVWSSSVIILN